MSDKNAIFSGKDTIDTALQLIRYDIPVLILGKSSIGKSYTLIDIAEKWRIPHQLLYIGSEKSENIEGIPRLTNLKEDKDVLEYLQPYWFPNAKAITKSVKNGAALFKDFTENYWDVKTIKKFTPNYMNLSSMLNSLSNVSWRNTEPNENDRYEQKIVLTDYEVIEDEMVDRRVLNPKKPFLVQKDGGQVSANDDSYRRDDVADLCAYLRTVLGYGNYWLILDEIDKVMDEDHDKFAPLLHIVRERTLKNFSMIQINEGKGLGVPLGNSFKSGGYENIIKDLDKMLVAGESVLDTRVMAIANKTKNIEEALFRRFVQLIAEDVMNWRPSDKTEEQASIEACLDKVKDEMVSANIQAGSLQMLPSQFQRLEEINLQWQYNFFPKILNDIDLQGNYFRQNALDIYDLTEVNNWNWKEQRKFSAFWKILSDNFHTSKEDFSIPNKLWGCLEPQLIDLSDEIGVSTKSLQEEIKGTRGIIAEKINQIGDLSLVADDIADGLRDTYPTRITSEHDKLTALHAWTDRIIEYLEASLKSNSTEVMPLDVSEYLVPSLVNVFYTELANDKNTITDNIIAVTAKFQSFFKELYELDPTFSLDCNKEATETAFYGGTSKEIKGFSKEERKDFSAYSLLGTDQENWDNSASGFITVKQMEDGFPNAVLSMLKDLGITDTIEKFVDADGSVEYLQNNYAEEIKDYRDLWIKKRNDLSKQGKTKAAQNFHDAADFLKMLLD